MHRESVIALDLEGTLISNAVSQFPRPGLRRFLDFCKTNFDAIYLYTAVRDELCVPILRTMVDEATAPEWILEIPFVQWDGSVKDLANIPNTKIRDCLLVDDNPDYIVDEQRHQWIAIEKFESPYPDTDRELERVQRLITKRLSPSCG